MVLRNEFMCTKVSCMVHCIIYMAFVIHKYDLLNKRNKYYYGPRPGLCFLVKQNSRYFLSPPVLMASVCLELDQNSLGVAKSKHSGKMNRLTV